MIRCVLVYLFVTVFLCSKQSMQFCFLPRSFRLSVYVVYPSVYLSRLHWPLWTFNNNIHILSGRWVGLSVGRSVCQFSSCLISKSFQCFFVFHVFRPFRSFSSLIHLSIFQFFILSRFLVHSTFHVFQPVTLLSLSSVFGLSSLSC